LVRIATHKSGYQIGEEASRMGFVVIGKNRAPEDQVEHALDQPGTQADFDPAQNSRSVTQPADERSARLPG